MKDSKVHPQRELFINSIRQSRIQGQAIVPTVVWYKDKKPIVALEALETCDRPSELKEDFKLQLGKDTPARLSQRRQLEDFTYARSVLGIAQDFIDNVIKQALFALEKQGFQRPSRILIAEPLSLTDERLAHEDWLKNYRTNLRHILESEFAEIDFMPEPFAVFQYYRYGIRHALVAQKQKHVALVFDFGGGTFDACVIETTASGDISQGGRNSKPLAAHSIPIGGFFINKIIAESLIFKGLKKGVDKARVRKAIDAYAQMKHMDIDTLQQPKQEYGLFVKNFRHLLQSVERAKLMICSSIISWKLDVSLVTSPACSVDVPSDPFDETPSYVSLRLEAGEIRTIYEQRIWKQSLLPAIKETLRRAEQELDGKPISIVLLSGGSSNIRWLKLLIDRDLGGWLLNAEILELSEDFQEIVSKGLAVECARRYYNKGEGDFRAVTYNRLCLGLNANRSELELKRYIPDCNEIEGIACDEGVLLPSSTSLKSLIGKPLRWKARLSKAPSQSLDYYFMRSSFDPNEMATRHNIDSRAITPKNTSFAGTIGVELTVRTDGTAEPVFIYGRGSKDLKSEVRVEGKPFYMDMTFAAEESGGDTYLGFDFGSSTSSLCYVDAEDIRVYADRASSPTWLSISKLIDILPYPSAHPLQRFLAETSPELIEKWGREALEGLLATIAYVAFCENCSFENARGGIFKGFRQRSAGPLWKLFKDCANASGSRWNFCKALSPLVSNKTIFEEIDKAVSRVNTNKHGKGASGIDFPRVLEYIGNSIAQFMQGKLFGYFEDSRKIPFSSNRHQGIFRNAKGPSLPFVDLYEYEGSESFPSEFIYVVDMIRGTAMALSPLMVRGLNHTVQYEQPDLFLYDTERRSGQEIIFKCVQEREEIVTSKTSAHAPLFHATTSYLEQDPCASLFEGLLITERRAKDGV